MKRIIILTLIACTSLLHSQSFNCTLHVTRDNDNYELVAWEKSSELIDLLVQRYKDVDDDKSTETFALNINDAINTIQEVVTICNDKPGFTVTLNVTQEQSLSLTDGLVIALEFSTSDTIPVENNNKIQALINELTHCKLLENLDVLNNINKIFELFSGNVHLKVENFGN